MIEPTDPRFKDMINQKNIKQIFESTALFYELYMQNYRVAGGWTGDIWYYDEPIIQEHYNTFTEGFISGVADYYISSADEKHRTERRMNAQMYESAGDDEIVLDITPYLK
jgi:hypothetical protein